MLLLATEIWRTHGGIQRYMRMLSRIFDDSADEIGIITLLDRDMDLPGSQPQPTIHCCGGNRWTFCLRAFQTVRKTSGITVVGHTHLLPIVWLLHTSGIMGRYVVVLHGIEAWRRLPWISRLAARQASAIVATTRYTVDEFCFHNRLSDANCVVIPLASSFPRARFHRNASTNEFRLLTITRLCRSDEYKGVESLLRAVRCLMDSGTNVKLDLVGNGDDLARFEMLSISLVIQDSVRFHGSVTDKQLGEFLASSHVFAMPSKKEGFGIVFLEAMASGLPCIGANHGGTPEVIQHGVDGFLVEYGDVEKIVFYVRILMDDPVLYEAMSRAALRSVEETFSFELMSKSWKTLIADIIGVHVAVKNDDSVAVR